MARVLMLFAHPAYQRSRINRHLIRVAADIEGVTVNDLYECYPDLLIDVRREQQLLSEHDVIAFHHPLSWYSSSAILKEWRDLVLTHGWAYGGEGRALEGKVAIQCVATEGGAQVYSEGGFNRFTIRQFIAPFDQTCQVCKMTWLGALVVRGTPEIGDGGGTVQIAVGFSKHLGMDEWIRLLRKRRLV